MQMHSDDEVGQLQSSIVAYAYDVQNTLTVCILNISLQ